ncbi:hypothetical protein Leryth_010748 [Lithospermum erythrorhizon]|nr:hypothetical protein Leryth_010748 [Lithospermum erythrorhizon]
METPQISQLLRQTLSPEANSAADALNRLSTTPSFPFSLLHIASNDEDQGVRIAAATFLKNLTRKNTDASNSNSTVSKEFKDALVNALLRAESAVLKVLIEAFRGVVAVEFVKNNSWPELVPELKMVIQESDKINPRGNSEWKTVNALTVLHSVIRPFQYFMNPKLAKEPVPSQLELISQEILVPLLAFFHQCVDKVSTSQGQEDLEVEKIILILAKCIYFAVRSHMPLALVPLLHSLCHDLTRLLNCLCFDGDATHEDKQSQMFKAGKRSLIIFCTFVTRHRKFTDKLMADITNSALKLVRNSTLLSKLGFLSERVISLAFDVISRVLETGPGWRLVSPHFSTLLDDAIFPALMMNEKDMEEWEEDADEYIRKNLPTELEEISGWREDLFTARKSALNLLGVIAISKGPPIFTSFSSKRKKGEKNKRKDRSSMGELLVLPFLAKFVFPTGSTNMKSTSEYYGVLMAYSSLLDFLMEQKAGFISTLLRMRVLPLYKDSNCQPYLMASANWVLGELSTCLPEDMSVDIYSSLMKALGMPDMADTSCYPVRISASGAISQLVENEYMPPEWLPLLKAVVGRISDDEEETSINLQLLSTLVETANEGIAPHIPHIIPLLARAISKCLADDSESWPQTVERGFATLAVMAQCWEQSMNEDTEQDESPGMWIKGGADISGVFSGLLQLAWLSSEQSMDGGTSPSEPPTRCLDDLSWLLWFILRCISGNDNVVTMRVSELLQVWSDIISDWHDWEEMEDISIFECIKEAVFLNKKITINNFIMRGAPTSSTSPVPRQSIVEGMAAFITDAFQQYPSAVRRASSTVHVLLHVTSYSNEGEGIKQALVTAFSRSAFSRFREIKTKPCPLWKSLLFTLSSCFLSNPETVETTLEEIESQGFTTFVSALTLISSGKSEQPLSTESEIKLTVLTLARAVEQLIKPGHHSAHLVQDCFTSMMEASMRLKELQEEDEEEEDEENTDEDDIKDEDTEDDEDSEDDEREETEEEFLERCAKAATELENDTIDEGDDEDEEHEIELGVLEEVDMQNIMLSLLERYHALLQGQLPSELIARFLQSFPEYHRLL